MRRLAAALAVTLALFGLALGPTAQADPANYGIQSFSASLSSTQAGAHADFTNAITLKTESLELPALTRNVTVELPPGLLGNPTAIPTCSAAQFVGTNVEDKSNATGCPQDSQVGITRIVFANSFEGTGDVIEPVFNLTPHPGEPARLGFIALQYPILIDTEIRPDYGITASVRGADTLATLYKTETTLWGVPADESHDSERMSPYESAHNNGAIETPTGTRHSGLAPVPFMLNQTRCGEASPLRAAVDSYQEPQRISEASTILAPLTGCGLLDFKPALSLAPTTTLASSATGLDAALSFPTTGLEHPNLLAPDEQRRAEVTLPEGVTVNPSQAEGLAACSEAEFDSERASTAPGQGCPEAAKIGTVTAKTPLLDEEAVGSLYVARPHANPFNTLIALYMVLRVPERGVIVKLPGKVTADPKTGQLTTTFGEAPYPIPQLPVSEIHLHFREGARAPLVTPSRCGTYTATATITSWGGYAITTHPSFDVNGAPCTPDKPFAPELQAGTINNAAATYSAYHMRIARSDGDRPLTRLSATLPPGLLAKLAGVSACPDPAIAAAASRTGTEELAAPSCPASSRVGSVLAGSGVGSVLARVPGAIYLAGPYRGAPISIAAIVPAVAGPFDLGTVVTRVGLRLNPATGVAEIDGSASEPIPEILEGIPLRLKDLRVYVDRPDFTLNPTSCAVEQTRVKIWGGGEDPLGAADDLLASLADRFQAADCAALAFRPRLRLALKGATRRASNPRLIANLTAKPGEANIARAQVKLPAAAFLDNSHIKTICTRVQFAADSCPPGSIYGKASAKTPLLDYALSGPVYLRSSANLLPDLVVKLKGPDSQPIEVDLVGRTDSVEGALRNTFTAVPDAPVSRFHLELFGGKRGLVELSRNLCKRTYRADVRLAGQNGRVHNSTPAVATSCGAQMHR